MSYTRLKINAFRTDWPEERQQAALQEYAEELVRLYVDYLLGYHAPGWAPVSFMFAGVLPGGGGSGEEDPSMVAARMYREITRAERDALYYIGQLKPRTQIALLIDSYSQRGHQGRNRLSRDKVCQPDVWRKLASELSLTRIHHQQPGLIEAMDKKALANRVARGKQKLAQVIAAKEKEAA
ncbi:hypothetical protein SAMN05660443_0232 [Marinospirillum celere]|uniref:Uncharacterized protein n=1 Tax=Marinospirillum celere TaxID=1122252 RepID=A0A1I1E188_9GAMM|nr:hypothetical protein [Marinospirillum celere]SFB80436.1 hypothetical protein SAMN05660443_0232 [Marinospirillum celere]